MNVLATHYAEAGYVLLVAGAAFIWAPLALLVAGAYFIVLAALHMRATPPVAAASDEAEA